MTDRAFQDQRGRREGTGWFYKRLSEIGFRRGVLQQKAMVMQKSTQNIPELLDGIYRRESRRVFATLIRLLGDFDLAEDAMQDAFKAALEHWGEGGVPANPVSWLVSAGRFRAIDRIRRQSRFDQLEEDEAGRIADEGDDPAFLTDRVISDDMLRLIFTCCNPAIPPEARTAMTLREVCGLTTEEIAHAFLITPSALAQRIVRAKSRIRDERIPFEVPPEHELPQRLEAVLQVIYLVFNEGYYASSGGSVTRADLSDEAIRLGRLLYGLLPDSEVSGILALPGGPGATPSGSGVHCSRRGHDHRCEGNGAGIQPSL